MLNLFGIMSPKRSQTPDPKLALEIHLHSWPCPVSELVASGSSMGTSGRRLAQSSREVGVRGLGSVFRNGVQGWDEEFAVQGLCRGILEGVLLRTRDQGSAIRGFFGSRICSLEFKGFQARDLFEGFCRSGRCGWVLPITLNFSGAIPNSI